MSRLIYSLLFPALLISMEIGNPAQPSLQKLGVIVDHEKTKWSLRLAYFGDYIYRMRFKDESGSQAFDSLEPPSTPTFMKLSTNAGLITMNLADRMDVYGILGTSQMQIDQELYTKREFSWGIGGKIEIAKVSNARFGLDIKYFSTLQKPTFFSAEGNTYNIVNDNPQVAYRLRYSEIQGALGMSYQTQYLSPYMFVSYLISKLAPQPTTALVRLPWDAMMKADIETKTSVGERRWGMAVGATLIGSPKATLTIESRFINQNAIDINGEIRF